MSKKKAMFFRQLGGLTTPLSDAYAVRVSADSGIMESLSSVEAAEANLTGNPVLWLSPSAYKGSKLYAVLPNETGVGTGDLTNSRASTGGRINQSNVWEQMSTDVPLIDYTFGTPEYRLEGQVYNEYLNSDVMVTQTNTVVSGRFYTVSFYGTGSITFTDAYAGSLVGTGANDRVEMSFQTTSTNLISTIAGTVEQGQLQHMQNTTVEYRYAGSYVPTTSTAVVKTFDTFTSDVDALIDTEFTLYTHFRVRGGLNNNGRWLFGLESDDNLNNVGIYRATANITTARFNISGTSSFATIDTISDFGLHKIAIVGTGTTIKVFVDGALATTKTGFTGISVLSTLSHRSGSSITTYQQDLRIRELLLYSTAFSDGDAITLTTL